MLLRLSRTRAVLCRTIIRPSSRARYASGGAYFRNALIGGAVGGVAVCGVIIGTGYSVYHFSGAKVVVDTVKPAMALMGVSKERLAERAPKQALDSLRQAAKAYVAFFPGAGFLVDRSFDAVDGVVEEHGQEATSIIMKAYDDMLEIMQKGGNDHKASSAMEVISVARRLVQELSALGLKAGQPYAERYELQKRVDAVHATAGSVVESIKNQTPNATETLVKLKDRASQFLPQRKQSTAETNSQRDTPPEETSKS